MAVVLLGANNTGDTSQTAINITPSTTGSGNLSITTPGIVSYVKLKMSQNSAIQSNGGHSFELRNAAFAVIATGTFDALGTVPKGDPAAWYTINLTGSPLVIINDIVHLVASKDVGTGILLQWRNSSIFPYMLEVWGEEAVTPGKATNPTPTDDQEDIAIAGNLRITTLTWNAPTDETPDYLVYFRASGGAWVLQETITDGSVSHTLSSDILDSLAYYSIYEWRVDTRESGLTTTGDTWTFISQREQQFTDYTRRSDYDADKVWQPGTGWVDINTFTYTGGGRFKGRVLVIGHQVVYFGDI